MSYKNGILQIATRVSGTKSRESARQRPLDPPDWAARCSSEARALKLDIIALTTSSGIRSRIVCRAIAANARFGVSVPVRPYDGEGHATYSTKTERTRTSRRETPGW